MEWQRFVAVGDSFTEGVGDPGPGDRDRGWADRLAEQLAVSQPDLHYANLAIRGRKLHQIVTEQVPTAVQMQPDLVTFAGGINDALRPSWDLPAMTDAVTEALSELSATGATVVVLTFGQPAYRSKVMGLAQQRFAQYRDVLLDAAARNDCLVVDFWEHRAFDDSRFWADDRLHLNSVGHERVTLAVMEALGVSDQVWWDALPPVSSPSPVSQAVGDARWFATHLAPWMGRRLLGRSSGDGVTPKRPVLLPVQV